MLIKKITAAAAALALCGAMLTACSGGDSGSADVSESLTSAGTAEETAQQETEQETSGETEQETEAEQETKSGEGSADSAGEYASFEEFAADKNILDIPESEIPAGDSLIYNFMKKFDGAKEFYLDAESADGSMAVVMAMSGNSVCMKTSGVQAGESADITILFKDSMMYMLDNASKTGFSSPADSESFSGFNIEEALSEIDMDAEIDSAEDVKVCTVTIGGADYTFEVADTGGGFLFADGELKAIAIRDNEYNLMLINAFGAEAPAELFEIPGDYEISDLSAAAGE